MHLSITSSVLTSLVLSILTSQESALASSLSPEFQRVSLLRGEEVLLKCPHARDASVSWLKDGVTLYPHNTGPYDGVQLLDDGRLFVTAEDNFGKLFTCVVDESVIMDYDIIERKRGYEKFLGYRKLVNKYFTIYPTSKKMTSEIQWYGTQNYAQPCRPQYSDQLFARNRRPCGKTWRYPTTDVISTYVNSRGSNQDGLFAEGFSDEVSDNSRNPYPYYVDGVDIYNKAWMTDVYNRDNKRRRQRGCGSARSDDDSTEADCP